MSYGFIPSCTTMYYATEAHSKRVDKGYVERKFEHLPEQNGIHYRETWWKTLGKFVILCGALISEGDYD